MYIKVWVSAGAKIDKLEKITDDHFEISVRAPAERNLANTRVCELVAAHLKIPVSQIRIVSGHHSPSKILSVREKI